MAAAECPELDRDRQRASTLRAVCAHVQLSWQEIWPLGFGTSGVRSRGKAVAPGPWCWGRVLAPVCLRCSPAPPAWSRVCTALPMGGGSRPTPPHPRSGRTWRERSGHPRRGSQLRLILLASGLIVWSTTSPPEGKESQFPGLEVATVVKLTRLPFRLPPRCL